MFRAAPGETNFVSYWVAKGGRFAGLRDDRAPVTAGRGCEQVDERNVRCTLNSAPERGAQARPPVEIDLGDGAAGEGEGGAGRDRASGGDGH